MWKQNFKLHDLSKQVEIINWSKLSVNFEISQFQIILKKSQFQIKKVCIKSNIFLSVNWVEANFTQILDDLILAYINIIHEKRIWVGIVTGIKC